MRSSVNGIKVAVRCRPYTSDDKLGVQMVQKSQDEGEVNLMNYAGTKGTKKHFAFTWSWWSAYGWRSHQKGDVGIAVDMKLIDQRLVYEASGVPIRNNVLDGHAVVRFIQFVNILFDSLLSWLSWHDYFWFCAWFLI